MDGNGDRALGRTTVLVGADGGRYPSGNSVLVAGTEERILIDPSLEVVARGGVGAPVDRVLLSHAHEDHMAGVHLFPGAHVHVHDDDLVGVRSLDGLMQVYAGVPDAVEPELRDLVVEQFHVVGRPDAQGFCDGARFDVGGASVEVVHLPGHTRGHCGFVIEPDGVFVVADIDLSSFGPYYGDHWSDLDDFVSAMARAGEVDARWYATFHHKGVIEGHGAFRAALAAYAGVIDRRDQAMLAFLGEPRTIRDMVAHRFVYRPGAAVPYADRVEHRTIEQHLARFLRRGAVLEVEPGWYRAT